MLISTESITRGRSAISHPTQEFDAIIIGTGQAGPSLAHRLAKAGKRVAIIERDRFGGTCVNTGCTPTKAMVASAYAAHLARRAADFGVEIAAVVTVDMKRVKARKDAIVAQSSSGLEDSLKTLAHCTVFEGHARFQGQHQVRVNDTSITAPWIFLNVGARASIPEIPGLDSISFLTNSTLLDIDALPKHLIIVGGSYVGLEFGQIFKRFGSEVTILERGRQLLGREDPDIALAVHDVFKAEGVQIHLNTKCTQLTPDPEKGITVTIEASGASSQIHGTHLLFAIGRRPNTDDLGLDCAGIPTDPHGYISVDDQLRTPVDGIWAIGDCNGRGAFTHTSYNDHEIVADNLLDGGHRRVTDRIPAYAVYIDPPLGRAGLSETDVRATGRPALIGMRPMTSVARAVEKGETHGFMKILVDAETKRILGAAILGTGGDEAIHSVLDLMYARAPYTVMTHAVHIHPTVSELIPTMLGELKPLEPTQ